MGWFVVATAAVAAVVVVVIAELAIHEQNTSPMINTRNNKHSCTRRILIYLALSVASPVCSSIIGLWQLVLSMAAVVVVVVVEHLLLRLVQLLVSGIVVAAVAATDHAVVDEELVKQIF